MEGRKEEMKEGRKEGKKEGRKEGSDCQLEISNAFFFKTRDLEGKRGRRRKEGREGRNRKRRKEGRKEGRKKGIETKKKEGKEVVPILKEGRKMEGRTGGRKEGGKEKGMNVEGGREGRKERRKQASKKDKKKIEIGSAWRTLYSFSLFRASTNWEPMIPIGMAVAQTPTNPMMHVQNFPSTVVGTTSP
jgi:hypothetical protein